MAIGRNTSRAQQAAATKKRIIRSARALMKKRGFDSVTIQMICEAADIKVGTFYHYFKAKEDLLMEFLPKAEEFEEDKVYQQTLDAHSFVQLITYYRYLTSFSFQGSTDLWANTMRYYSIADAITRLRTPKLVQVIARGQERGEFTRQVSADYIARMITLTNRGIFVEYVNHPESMDYPRMAMDALWRLAYSYLTEEGIASLPEEFKSNRPKEVETERGD